MTRLKELIERKFTLKSQLAEIENDILSINEHLEDTNEGDDRRALDKRRHLRNDLILKKKEMLECECDLELTKEQG